jgi:hypothetical protein
MFLREALPEFYDELTSILDEMGRPDLSGQIRYLEIVQKCPCSDGGCASFQVSAHSTADSFETPGARSSFYTKAIQLTNVRGKIKLGLDQLGRITSFEILNRPDIRKKLLRRR